MTDEAGPQLDARNIALVGPMGVGKSTIARVLADWLGRQSVDTDDLIVRATGKPIAQVFATDGEAAFRALEVDAIQAVCERDRLVVSVGGGAVLDSRNVARLRASSHVVRLDGEPAVLARRVEHGRRAGNRPLLSGDEEVEATLRRLRDEREDAYASAAHLTVSTGDRPIEAVAAEVLRALEDHLAAQR